VKYGNNYEGGRRLSPYPVDPDENQLIYYVIFKKYPIFATNFLYKIMSNLLIISSFKFKS